MAETRERPRTPGHVRVLRRVVPTPGPLETDCLVFAGCINADGYGHVLIGGHDGKPKMAHKVVWEATHGPVPKGMELDHLCRVRSCVNEAHLEAVSHRENVLRGQAPAVLRHHAGICARGHQLEEIGPNGRRRQCRQCVRDAYNTTYHYLRNLGFTAAQAQANARKGEYRRAAGLIDMRRSA